MSDTPTPRTDALMEEWHHCPPTKNLLKHARQLERELAEARKELSNQESECGRFSVIVRDLNAQLTAQKATLEKCETALLSAESCIIVEGCENGYSHNQIREALAAITKLKGS